MKWLALALTFLLSLSAFAQPLDMRLSAWTPQLLPKVQRPTQWAQTFELGEVANLITSGVVRAASPLELPLSTTRVSCGSLFGIGAVTRQARWKTIAGILLAWVVTLPLAAALGAGLLRIFPLF